MIRSHRSRATWRRVLARLAADPHVQLAVAVVLAALAIEWATRADTFLLLWPGLVYLAIQTTLGLSRRIRRSAGADAGRLLLALAAVLWMSVGTGNAATLPLATLMLPIIAMAAALGTREVLVVGGAILATALLLYFVPGFGSEAVQAGLVQRGIALGLTAVVLAVGTRRTVVLLERAVARARTASAEHGRRGRQMAAVEEVGRLLAARGPSADALDEVMTLLVDRFGYRYVSIYTLDGDLMRLGAQRGYDDVIETFDGSIGIVGRVMRTGNAELVTDVLEDPEYRAASPDVRCEVSVPLRAPDSLIGVLNVESGQDDPPLDESDLDALVLVGDRVAAALALAREREALRDRAALFARLAAFGTGVNASLEPATAYAAIVRSVADVLETDIVVLVLRDPATGDDRIAAMHGGDSAYVGARIPPGDGMSGKAIAERRIVTASTLSREAYPKTVQGARVEDVLTAAAMPLLSNDDVVMGAISLSRRDLDRPYNRLELEAMPLIAAQATLVLTNVALHAQVADAAIRDPLTGLWNRRHLEVSVERLFAARARLDPELRHPVAAIMFDLDHFGSFNKQHGHATGDAVLRAFGSILSGRLRSSDIVARFGGEEFVAILDGATVEEAQRVAEEIRRELEDAHVTGIDGDQLRPTVSAGCASLGPTVSSLDTLLEVADVGLQMAKRGGRNQVVAA